jgi:AcrR family transcriptional regulator
MVRKPTPEKRARFLNSALRLFAANGVQNTSTAAIARDAGTAAGTLFLYFPTKQDLVHELILQVSREQSDYIKGLLRPSLSARQTFLTVWDGSLRWFMANRDAYQYVMYVRHSGLIDPAIVQRSQEHFDYYFDAIQKGLEEGAIRPYPFELIGEMLYQALVAVMSLIEGQPDPARQDEYIRDGFEIFWNGLATRKEA